MIDRFGMARFVISAVLVASFWLTPIVATAQDLVAVSSLTGSSSVFVFRNNARPKRVAVSRPTRTVAQRRATAVKVKHQYETLAKVAPRRAKAAVVDPTKIPPKAEKTLPAAKVSVLFAGVGEFYLDKGSYAQSFDFFRDAIRLDGTNAAAKTGFSEALTAQANEALANDKTAEAKGIFLEALKYNPQNAAALFGLGEAFADLGESAAAIKSYEDALNSDRELTEIYVPLGILYYQAGDISKADDLLTKALASNTESGETQFFHGLVRAAQNKDEEALAAFLKAETLDKDNAEIFFNAGETLSRLKRYSEAIPEYEKAVALKADYFDAWSGLGEANYKAEKYKEAIKAYDKAVTLKNDNWEALAGLGDSYLKDNQFNNAAAKLNLAGLFLTNTKDFNKIAAADIYSKVGYAYGQQCEEDTAKFRPCQWPAAIKALDKAIAINGDPVDYTNLGWAYLNASRVDQINRMIPEQQEKLAKAKDALLKVKSTNPVIEESAQQNLGAVLNDLGDYQGAIDILQKVIAKHPEWTFAIYAMGSAYAMLKDNDQAANAFKQVIAKGPGPNYVPALKNLGAIEIRRKNKNEVKRIIDELRKLDPAAALALEQQMKLARL